MTKPCFLLLGNRTEGREGKKQQANKAPSMSPSYCAMLLVFAESRTIVALSDDLPALWREMRALVAP